MGGRRCPNFYFHSFTAAKGAPPPEGERNPAEGGCFADIYIYVYGYRNTSRELFGPAAEWIDCCGSSKQISISKFGPRDSDEDLSRVIKLNIYWGLFYSKENFLFFFVCEENFSVFFLRQRKLFCFLSLAKKTFLFSFFFKDNFFVFFL